MLLGGPNAFKLQRLPRQRIPCPTWSATLETCISSMLARLAKRKSKETVAWPSPSLLVSLFCCLLLFGVGGDLLSHNLPVAVPSACAGLASGFGMGPGVSLQLLTTDKHAKHKPFFLGAHLGVGVVSDTA